MQGENGQIKFQKDDGCNMEQGQVCQRVSDPVQYIVEI